MTAAENETQRTLRQAQGEPGLRRGRVLIVGVGGLGSPAALFLADAGVGTIGLVDPDVVDVSNLQRQIIHNTSTVGNAKVDSGAAAIRARHPEVEVRTFHQALTADNLRAVFSGFDFVIDATDGAATKFLINDGAVLCDKPYSHAGCIGWVGQTMTVLPGRSACYRCLFPTPPDDEDLSTCQATGILGAVAGAIGIVQATEAVKFLLGAGSLLTDRLLTYDALALRWRVVPVRPNRGCPLCGPDRTIVSLHGASPAA